MILKKITEFLKSLQIRNELVFISPLRQFNTYETLIKIKSLQVPTFFHPFFKKSSFFNSCISATDLTPTEIINQNLKPINLKKKCRISFTCKFKIRRLKKC